MSQQIIDTGGEPGAGGGDDLFTAFTKINDNFTEIYSGGVVAANVQVYSVAGRTGNVVLTAQDILGVATYGNIAVLQQNITAALASANSYTDDSIANLGALGNVEITGGTIQADLSGSFGTLANLEVTNNVTINGQLEVMQGASVGGTLVLGDQLIFDDSTIQTTAFQGFGNIFPVAAATNVALGSLQSQVSSALSQISTLTGNLVLVDNTIYVSNTGGTITLQPDGTGNVYIGQSGANDLVLGKGVWFDDGTYQDTAYIPGEFVSPTELASNVAALGQRIDAANAAIAINTSRVNAANAQISTLTSTVSAQASSDAANVAAANAAIATTNSKITAANLAIASTNANVAAANAVIVSLQSAQALTATGLDLANVAIDDLANDITSVQSDLTNSVATLTTNAAVQGGAIASLQSGRTSTNANVAAANAAIAALQSAQTTTAAGLSAANAVIATNSSDITSLQSGLSGVQTGLSTTNNNLAGANAAITSLQSSRASTNANVAAANAAIATLQSSVSSLLSVDSAQAATDAAINANVAAANAAILSVSGRISAANLEISKLRANLTAANAQISTNTSSIATLSSDVSDLMSEVSSLQDGLDLANATIIHNADVYTDLSDAANIAIADLQNNVSDLYNEIGMVQDGLDAANAAIVSLGAFDPAQINANVAAANAVIAFQGARITYSNTLISAVRANIAAANTQIATFQSELDTINANVAAANAAILLLGFTEINALNSNIAAANVEIDKLRANLIASNVRIGRLESNIGAGLYANSQISVLRSTISAANAVAALASANLQSEIDDLYANAAVQYASLFNLQGNALAQQNAIASRAPINNPSLVGEVTVTGNVTATANVNAAAVNAPTGVFTDVTGTVKTNAQPYIESVGTLTGLSVAGNIDAYGITSLQGITGQIKTGNQPLITAVGTLSGLAVTGSANISGALGVNSIIADLAITTPLVTAGTVFGTLGTAPQPFITSVGNLVSLAVDGITNLNDIIVAGNIRANAARSQLAVNSVSTNSIIGVSANISNYANIDSVFGSTASFRNTLYANNLISSYDVTAARVISTSLAGTLETASQPNITTIGTLGSLAVTGNTDIAANANISGNVRANWLLGNVYGRTATFLGNVTTGNLSAAYITGVLRSPWQPYINEVGTLLYLNVDGDTTITGNLAINSQYGLLAATQGSFTIVDGYLTNPTQPNVTAVGTLTGLNVAGTVNVSGSQYITQDLWILGNMFVNGNTTTVSAGNVTTTDKDLTLANDAISSSAARGAGIYIGNGGVYGNLSIYDGVWATPNDFAIGGNLSAPRATFTSITGTLSTTSQPNITSVGTLTGLSVGGALSATSLSVTTSGTFANVITSNVSTTTVSAGQGDFTTLNVSNDILLNGLLTVSNIVFADGTFQNTTANSALATSLFQINANTSAANAAIQSLQANITAANSIIANNSSDILALYANASVQQIQIDLLNSNIAAANNSIIANSNDILSLYSNASVQQIQIASLNANLAAANAALASTDANVAYANAAIVTLSQLNLGGDPTFVGNIYAAGFVSRGNIQSGGPYNGGNITLWNNTGNATITTDSANLYINNWNAGVYATPFLGNVIIDANLLVNGNTVVRANLYSANFITGNITSGFVQGVLTTAYQPNITQVGTLVSLQVTGNVSAGNISSTKGTFSQTETNSLTANTISVSGLSTLTSLSVSNDTNLNNLTVANVTITDQFGVTGSLNLAGNLQVAGNTALANARVTGNLSAGGNLYLSGTADIGGNIVTASQGIRNANSILDNNLYTSHVTAGGNLSVSGNATTASLTTGPISASNIQLTAATGSTSTVTGALVVAGGAGLGGNLWVGGNANVSGGIRTSTVTADGITTFNAPVNFNWPVIESNQTGLSIFNAVQIDQILFGLSASEIRIGEENPFGGPGLGNVYVRNNLDVFGNTAANGNSIVRATTESTGTYTGALQVFGGAWFGANVYSSGNLDIAGTARVSGKAYVGGTAYIAGNTTIAANTDITGTTTITGNIRTSGSNLRVTANTTVTGDTSIVGNLTIVAPITAGNSFAVGGNVSMNASLHVKETIYANGLIVAGGIGIPNIDNTPVGDTTPSRGSFSTLKSFVWQYSRPRPNQRPRLMLDFANNQNLDPRISFTRNSIGTYFDSTANLAVASAGQPRFDHDPITNTARGLLIEESRTNYLKYSSAFTNTSYWLPMGASIVATADTDSPAGLYNDAVAIVEDTYFVTHGVYPNPTNNQYSYTPTSYYAASAFVKAGLRTQFGITFQNEGSGPIFDLVTKSVLQEGSAPGGFTTTSQIKELANGWFRISTVLYKQNSNGNVLFHLAAGGSLIYNGSAGTVGGYIFGAQMEEGSFATSYIPTATAAVTRAADDVSITTVNFNTFYSSNEGMLLVDSMIDSAPTNKSGAINGVSPVTVTSRPTFLSMEGASVTNRIVLLAETVTVPSPSRFGNLVIYRNGVLQSNLGSRDTYFTSLDSSRFAVYFKANAMGVTTNGNTAAVDTTGFVPDGLNTMYIGKGTASGYLNGTIAKISYFARTSASSSPGDELIALTQQ